MIVQEELDQERKCLPSHRPQFWLDCSIIGFVLDWSIEGFQLLQMYHYSYLSQV